jgi:hypothetical protein
MYGVMQWVHSSGIGRNLNFGPDQRATDMVEPPAKRWRGAPIRRPMVSFMEQPRAAPQQEGQIADDSGKEPCFSFRDKGRCRRGTSCRYEHVDKSQQ